MLCGQPKGALSLRSDRLGSCTHSTWLTSGSTHPWTAFSIINLCNLPSALHYKPSSVLHMLRLPCHRVLNYHQPSNKVMQEHAVLIGCFINGPLNNQKSLYDALHLFGLVLFVLFLIYPNLIISMLLKPFANKVVLYILWVKDTWHVNKQKNHCSNYCTKYLQHSLEHSVHSLLLSLLLH